MKSNSVQTNTIGQASTFSVELTKQIVVVVLSFLVSNTKIQDYLSPFGIAFTASMPKGLYYTSFIGSFIGYIFMGGIINNIPNIIALTIVLLSKLIINNFKGNFENPIIMSVISFFSVFLSKFFGILFSSFSFPRFLLVLSVSFLVASMSYFCCICINSITFNKSISHLNIFEKSSSIIVGSVILISICNIQLIYLNIGKVIGIVLILSMAYKYSFVGGAITGIIVSISVTLYDPRLAIIAGGFIIAGFISGVFNNFGRLLLVSVFIIVNSISFVLVGSREYMFMTLIDILFAGFIFLCIPTRFYEKFIIRAGTTEVFNSTQANFNISSRLKFASKTISDLQNSVETVSKKIDDMTQNDINNIFQNTTDTICRRCGLNMVCWDTCYNDTINALNKTARLLKVNGRITKFDIPYYFQKKCCKLDALVESINKSYKNYIKKETTIRRVTEVRNIAIEQFEAMADMLCEISKEIGEVSKFDDRSARLVRQIFENNGTTPSQVCCLVDKYGRVCIDVYVEGEFKTDTKILSSQISDTLQREFDLPSVMTVDSQTKISFFEFANFKIDFYALQTPCEQGDICGDSYEYFSDSKGFAHIILSDGMGSGKKAAIDSVMTCSLVLKLIKAGFGFESALKLINSSLLVKSREESIATLDIATIDLYTGKVYFNKAGAASSFVYKNNKVLKIDSRSLPIGILKGVTFDKKILTVSDNSIIVMVSDGIISTGSEWIKAELELHKKKTAKDIANIISKEAKRRLSDDRSDDMTVIVSKIKGVKII